MRLDPGSYMSSLRANIDYTNDVACRNAASCKCRRSTAQYAANFIARLRRIAAGCSMPRGEIT